MIDFSIAFHFQMANPNVQLCILLCAVWYTGSHRQFYAYQAIRQSWKWLSFIAAQWKVVTWT